MRVLTVSCPFPFPGRRACFSAVHRDSPRIRCAAQSAEISSQGIPQTFSV